MSIHRDGGENADAEKPALAIGRLIHPLTGRLALASPLGVPQRIAPPLTLDQGIEGSNSSSPANS